MMRLHTMLFFKAFLAAQQEAMRTAQDYFEPAHLFLALLDSANSLAYQVLTNAGITQKEARIAVEQIIPQGLNDGSKIAKLSTEAIAAITSSEQIAISIGHKHVGTEHLLMALLQDDESAVCSLLLKLGQDRKHLQKEIEKLLTEYFATQGADAMPPDDARDQPGSMTADIYNWFNMSVIDVLQAAESEAKKANHRYIEPMHILLGILSVKECTAFKILADKATLTETREAVRTTKPIGKKSYRTAPIGPVAKLALQQAWHEAKTRKLTELSSEHLLLGLLENEEENLEKVMHALFINAAALKIQVLALVDAQHK